MLHGVENSKDQSPRLKGSSASWVISFVVRRLITGPYILSSILDFRLWLNREGEGWVQVGEPSTRAQTAPVAIEWSPEPFVNCHEYFLRCPAHYSAAEQSLQQSKAGLHGAAPVPQVQHGRVFVHAPGIFGLPISAIKT
jgi:hypothetical protein